MAKRQDGKWGRACTIGAVVCLPLLACTSAHAGTAGPLRPPAVATTVASAEAPTKGTPFSSPELGFELDKPAGNKWAVATNVTSPEGRPIPVVVAHPDSGAQIVIQVSDPVDSPKTLTSMLRDKLQAEQTLTLGKAEKLQMDSGSEAYGFSFTAKGEAKGRVAVISVGDEIVLVVASWPENADKNIVQDIDGVVRSVRSPSGASRTSMRPDKA